MQKPNLVACLVILLTFSAPALAGGAPGSTGAPGGGAPGASSSSGATTSPSTGSDDGGLGFAAEGGPQGGREGGPGGGGPLTPEKLAAIKAEHLKRMDAHIAAIQQRKQCVQAATTGEALRACMPKRSGRGGPGGGGQQGQPE